MPHSMSVLSRRADSDSPPSLRWLDSGLCCSASKDETVRFAGSLYLKNSAK